MKKKFQDEARIFLFNKCFKSHVEKVHESCKSCNQSSFQKGESKHHKMNQYLGFYYHPNVQFVIRVVQKDMNLRRMLTQSIEMRIHTTPEL